MSTNTGMAPLDSTAVMVAMKVYGGTSIYVAGADVQLVEGHYQALVPFTTARLLFTPSAAAHSFSNSVTMAALDHMPLLDHVHHPLFVRFRLPGWAISSMRRDAPALRPELAGTAALPVLI